MTDHECYMEDKIEEINEKVDKVSDKVDLIYCSLVGNELGTEGIIPTQKRHEFKIVELDRIKIINDIKLKTIIAIAGFAGTVLGIIFEVIVKFLIK